MTGDGAATARAWWREWLGVHPDPAGTWELGPARRTASPGHRGEVTEIRLTSFGSDLVAQLFRPDGAIPGALVVVPFYDAPSVLGIETPRTRLQGRHPGTNAHGLHLAAGGLSVLAVPWWFEETAAADPATAGALPLDERYGPPARRHHRELPMTALGRSVADLALAVSAVLAEHLADEHRLAVFGHSLGAKLALHLAALDPRVAAAVAHEPGLGLAHSNWRDPWYLGAHVPPGRDHDELLGLVAPRPFLLAGGGDSDGEHNRALAQRAAAAWPAGRGLDLLHHNAGHPLPHHVMAAVATWLTDRLTDRPGTTGQ